MILIIKKIFWYWINKKNIKLIKWLINLLSSCNVKYNNESNMGKYISIYICKFFRKYKKDQIFNFYYDFIS